MDDPLNISTDKAFYTRDQLIELMEKERRREELFADMKNDLAEIESILHDRPEMLSTIILKIIKAVGSKRFVTDTEVDLAETVSELLYERADKQIFR